MPDAPTAADSVARLVVWDFDGTVCVGDAPVHAYLQAVLDRIPNASDDEIRRSLNAYFDGDPAGGGTAADGYALVGTWAREQEAPAAVLSEAYAASRSALHDGRIEVAAPAGLAALLDGRPAGVVCALVTNAPVTGIDAVLERIGLAGRFDVIVGDAGKPAGMPGVLAELLDRFDLPATALLSVGDIWVNDLQPAARIGGTTALIDRFGRGEGSPDLRAATLPELAPAVEQWWSACS